MSNPTDSDRATAELVMDGMTCFKAERCVRPPCACLNAIAAALAAEREACAKAIEIMKVIVLINGEEYTSFKNDVGSIFAATIRARSKPNEEK